MITREDMYVDTFSGQLTDLFAERMVLPFLRIADEILHPEIEHVAEHVDRRGVFTHLFQHLDEFFLMCPASLDRQATQMCITKEIYHVLTI